MNEHAEHRLYLHLSHPGLGITSLRFLGLGVLLSIVRSLLSDADGKVFGEFLHWRTLKDLQVIIVPSFNILEQLVVEASPDFLEGTLLF